MNEEPNNNTRIQSESILQEGGTERPTEVYDDRFTKVDNGYQNNLEIVKNEEKTENLNQDSPLYNTNKQTFNIKIIVLGDISVGKTSIIKRYITNAYSEDARASISCEFAKKTLEIDANTSANLNIWDTAGEEKFMSVTKQFYNDSHGAMIVYDLTKKNTFLKINKWIKDIKEKAPKDVVIMIVGNKSDLVNEKVELGDELKSLQESYEYQDVSAKCGNNVSLAFEKITLKIVTILKEKKEKGDEVQRDSIPLKKKKDKKHTKCNLKKC